MSEHYETAFVNKPVAMMHDIYISGPLESPEKLCAEFDHVRSLGPNDQLNLKINSTGGDLFTAIQWLTVLAETEATIVAYIEGACMSAATMIMLSADAYQINPHSMIMLHNYSGGSMGKGHEMAAQLEFERKWSKAFLKDVYKDFLTQKEIDSIWNGTDLWMTGAECADRLNKRQAKRDREALKDD